MVGKHKRNKIDGVSKIKDDLPPMEDDFDMMEGDYDYDYDGIWPNLLFPLN